VIYLKAVILAVVEGITEFLPISSTGHLILVEEFIHLGSNGAFAKAFTVVIQLPAILAVVVYFRNDLWPFVDEPNLRRERLGLWAKIVVAVIPAAILGFLFDDTIESVLLQPIPVVIALIIGGIVLILVERVGHREIMPRVHDIGFAKALAIGLFQCLALFPGTSRSAATIIGGMVLGASRPAAAEFSFFLAIPTMAGATALTLAKSGASFTSQEWAVLALGSVVSFAVAYAAIAWLMNYLRTRDFTPFGYYRIALGILVLVYFAIAR
jgi:undecaprenyl-diphosphatase